MFTDPSHPAPEGSRDCGTFFLDVIGQYAPSQLIVRWLDLPRASNPDIDRKIEQTWTDQASRAAHSGRKLFNGPLCRVIECTATPRELSLTLGPVTFKELLGTNLTQAYIRYTYGQEVLADPLGVSAAVVTADGFILMGRRSQKVMFHGGRVHPIGGMVEPAEPPALPDPFATLYRELAEETNLTAAHVRELLCLGLVRDKHIVQPELVFDVAVDSDVETILRGSLSAVDMEEHDELVTIRNYPSAVVTYIEQHFGDLTPVGLATLLLHGLRHWGSGWFAAARGYLRSVV